MPETLKQQLKFAAATAAMWQGLAEKLSDAVVALCERRAGQPIECAGCDELRRQVSALDAQLASFRDLSSGSDAANEAEHLRRIREWPFTDCAGLMEFVAARWSAHYGHVTRDGNRVEIVTGGWADNEALIAALQDNVMAWGECWQESRRGGYYRFEAPEWESGK